MCLCVILQYFWCLVVLKGVLTLLGTGLSRLDELLERYEKITTQNCSMQSAPSGIAACIHPPTHPSAHLCWPESTTLSHAGLGRLCCRYSAVDKTQKWKRNEFCVWLGKPHFDFRPTFESILNHSLMQYSIRVHIFIPDTQCADKKKLF